MSDVFSKSKRSEVMSRIRGRGNKGTELMLVRIFRAHGITGWRRHLPVSLNGHHRWTKDTTPAPGPTPRPSGKVRPDFVFRAKRVVVFVDGCFWHGCPRHATQPGNNAAFWMRKLEANRERDRQVNRRLRRNGWTVVRVWEHELTRKRQGRMIARLRCLAGDEVMTNNDGAKGRR